MVRSKLPKKNELFLEPFYAKPNMTVIAHIVNCGMTKIFMQNNVDNVLIITSRTQLGRVIEYKAERCYKAYINAIGIASMDRQCSTIGECVASHSNTVVPLCLWQRQVQ